MKETQKQNRLGSRKGLLIAVVVLITAVLSVGGTLAWLTDSTDSVTNTFTASKIDITLTEDAGRTASYEFKMLPGADITKDPKVTVKKDSEDCWLFVSIAETDNFDDFMTYDVADGWTALSGVTGVYYREVTASTTADQAFSVLAGDKVMVNNDVDGTAMEALTAETYPKLTFTAFACQKAGIGSAAAAWAEVQQPSSN